MVDHCSSCGFDFLDFHHTKCPFNDFEPNDLLVQIWRSRWKEGHLTWQGDELLKPSSWDPIEQMHHIDIHLADNFAEWMAEHPIIVPENKEQFLDIALRKLAALDWEPQVVEALWDGDTQGWFLCLTVRGAPSETDKSHHANLLILRGSGGDIRLFNGQVPPWPESVVIGFVGEEIGKELNIPFYFPS